MISPTYEQRLGFIENAEPQMHEFPREEEVSHISLAREYVDTDFQNEDHLIQENVY